MSTTNSVDHSPSSSPINSNNAPKFGTLVPNRIFVGGITPNTSESELFEIFSAYGNVKATKIIADRAGVSKGYGFVTFETEEEALRIQKEDNVILKDRKLNIAPAIRKQASFGQPFGRTYGSSESSSDRPGTPRQSRNSVDWNVVPAAAADPAPLIPSNSAVYYHNGASYYTPNGAIYAPSEGGYQYSQPQYYPTMVYSPVYIQPQYPQFQSPTSTQSQWSGQAIRWASHVGYGQSLSPHTSPSSSASSIPQYVYTTNGCPATPSTNSGQTTSSATTTMAVVQTQSGGEPGAMNPPIPPTAIAYPYPPPAILAPYQPNIGSGDVADASMVEASTSTEQSPHAQDSMGHMVAVSHTGVSAAVHFVRAFPTQVHDSDEYRLPPYEQGLPANYRGYRKAYQSGSPRKMHFSYNQPTQQYRPKGRAGLQSYNLSYNNQPASVTTPTNNGIANSASGSAHKKTNGNPTSPLTPPPTPSATNAKENGSVAETAHRFKSLNL